MPARLPKLADLLSCAELRAVGLPSPGWLADLEAAFGQTATRRLLRAAAGREVNVPERDVRGSALDRAVGPNVARWMQRELGHGRLRVPLAGASLIARRRFVVRSWLAAGRSLEDTAAAAQCSVRTVCNIKSRLRDAHLLPEKDAP